MLPSVLAFKSYFLLLSSCLEPARLRRLVELAALGLQGPKSWELIGEFREFFALHLLVLSGSQVQHLRRALLSLEGGLCRALPMAIRQWLRPALLFWAYYIYGQSCAWSPPLARALLLGSLGESFPMLWPGVQVAVTFVLQLSVFPEHASQSSFYLSWLSFLLLTWSRHWPGPAVLRLMTLNAACQVLLLLLVPQLRFDRSFLCGLLANVALAPLFERLLLPLLGSLLALALVAAWLMPSGDATAVFLLLAGWAAYLLKGAAGCILVALEALRYIFGV